MSQDKEQAERQINSAPPVPGTASPGQAVPPTPHSTPESQIPGPQQHRPEVAHSIPAAPSVAGTSVPTGTNQGPIIRGAPAIPGIPAPTPQAVPQVPVPAHPIPPAPVPSQSAASQFATPVPPQPVPLPVYPPAPTATPVPPPAQPPHVAPTATPVAPAVQPAWAPEQRGGRVGNSVEAALAGQTKGPAQKTSKARYARIRSQQQASTFATWALVIGGAIVVFGLVLLLITLAN